MQFLGYDKESDHVRCKFEQKMAHMCRSRVNRALLRLATRAHWCAQALYTADAVSKANAQEMKRVLLATECARDPPPNRRIWALHVRTEHGPARGGRESER